MPSSRTDTSYLQPRIQAIEVPCPCSTIAPRTACLLGTAGLSVLYLLWAIGTWWAYFGVNNLKAFVEPSTSAFAELRGMASFALFSAWYFSTTTLLASAAFVASVFPRAELAKHLSRSVWIFGWMATWFVGIYGMAAHLSADSWISAGCVRGDPCDLFRRWLQIWMLVALFITLALVFWFSLAFSSFVHTLHPHIFHTGDVDSELDEHDHAQLLEDELRRSDHPLAPHALEWLQAQKAQDSRNSGGDESGQFRRRKAYQTQSDGSGSESGSDDDMDRKILLAKRSDSPPGPQPSVPSLTDPSSRSSRRPGQGGPSNETSSALSSSDDSEGEVVVSAKEESSVKSASLSRSRSRSLTRSRSSRH
ncbi:hypothetical protein JCM11491_006586 [Sporobolomyces phaffii]